MRFLPATLALTLAITAPVRATDFPTIKTPIPDLTTAQGNALAVDLRDSFEVTSIVGQVVQFRTTLGTYNLEMLPADAPASVTNFLTYVNGARFANTFIHRSDTGLGIIQGGGYIVTQQSPIQVGHIATDPPVVLEYNLPNTRGTIAMARTSVLNSGTSEWFINTDDNTTSLGQGNAGGYAVFGRVTGTGMTVVDAIAATPIGNFGGAFTTLPVIGYSGTGAPLPSNLIYVNAAEAVPVFAASAGQNSVVGFSVTSNSNPALVTATVSGSALNLALAAGQSGVADLTVTATDSNGNAVQDTFQINATAGVPEIAVEQPAGSDVADGGSRAFPTVNAGSTADLVFTIHNTGTAGLALMGTPKVAVDGADAVMFTVTAQPASVLNAPGGSTTFTVRFAPTSSGVKTAALHIANNDSDEAQFDIALTGTGNSVPILTLPASPVIAEATAASGAVVTFAVTANDADDGTLTPNVAPASGSTFALGDTTVNVSATDANGAQTTGSFIVRVRDTTAPALTVPANQVVEATSASGAVANYPLAMVSDAVGVTSLTYSKNSGTNFPLGVTTVTVTAKDAANNTATQTFTVTVAFLRPTTREIHVGARSGDPAPGGPTGAALNTFGPPAVSDARDLAARVAMLVERKTLGGIYVEDLAGAGSVVAYQGGPVPGIAAADVTFKSFLDPVLASDGSLAFAGKVQGGGMKPGEDSGVWSDAFGAALELVLRESSEVPGLPVGARLKAVSSLSLRNGELLALVTLSAAKGVVAAGDDTVLLRMTGASTATALLREGRELAGLAGSKIKSFSVLSPALGSPGHGRWHADGVVVAKVALFDGRTLLVKLAPDGTVTKLLSTADAATPVDPAARWKSFGLPAVGSAGTGFVVAATLQPKLGNVAVGNDTALLFSTDGAAWTVIAREGAAAPVTPAGLLYASFFDPVVNDAGHVAFLATLQGTGIKSTNKTALFGGPVGAPQLVARLGDPAPDAAGAATAAVWGKFISHALASGAGADAIFLAETTGGDTTPKNKLTLCAVDSHGAVRRLLRTDDVLAASLSPLTGLTLLNAAPGAYGATRSLNATASVALVATFADRTQALLRVDIP